MSFLFLFGHTNVSIPPRTVCKQLILFAQPEGKSNYKQATFIPTDNKNGYIDFNCGKFTTLWQIFVNARCLKCYIFPQSISLHNAIRVKHIKGCSSSRLLPEAIQRYHSIAKTLPYLLWKYPSFQLDTVHPGNHETWFALDKWLLTTHVWSSFSLFFSNFS